jgi:NAD(P)-dependent dehydrogenase (short-subunit alcohol dehydrogenase family)
MPGAPEFRGRTVLVTGGTRGIGRAIGLAFGRLGARCILTHRWGSVANHDLERAFAEAAAQPPRIVQADVSSADDTAALFAELSSQGLTIDVLVSNVSFSLVTNGVEDYRRRSLLKSLEYSAWPLVSYTCTAAAVLGRAPRYVVGISSPGPSAFHVGYDFAASAKSVMETLSRYVAYRLQEFDTRVNVIRPGGVFTESLDSTFGRDFRHASTGVTDPSHFFTADQIADPVVALCSGWMDAVHGQTIHIDRGTPFFDNAMRLYGQRERYGLRSTREAAPADRSAVPDAAASE